MIDKNKELINKLDNIELSSSEENKINSDNFLRTNLINFLSSKIEEITSAESLKQKFMNVINDRIDFEGPDNIPWGVLLEAVKILGRNDNELTLGIFDIIKNSKRDIDDEGKKKLESNDLSKKDIDSIKTLLNILNKVNESEFSEEKEE